MTVGAESIFLYLDTIKVVADTIVAFYSDENIIHIETLEHPSGTSEKMCIGSVKPTVIESVIEIVNGSTEEIATGEIDTLGVMSTHTNAVSFYFTTKKMYHIIGGHTYGNSIPSEYRLNVKLSDSVQVFKLVSNRYVAHIDNSFYLNYRKTLGHGIGFQESFFNTGDILSGAVKIVKDDSFSRIHGKTIYDTRFMSGMKCVCIGERSFKEITLNASEPNIYPDGLYVSTTEEVAIKGVSEVIGTGETTEMVYPLYEDFPNATVPEKIDSILIEMATGTRIGFVNGVSLSLGTVSVLMYGSNSTTSKNVKDTFLPMFTYSKYESGYNSSMAIISGYEIGAIEANVPKVITPYYEDFGRGTTASVEINAEIDGSDFEDFITGQIVIQQPVLGVTQTHENIGIFRIGSFNEHISIGLNREIFIDKVDTLTTEYSPRIVWSGNDANFEVSNYSNILNFNRTNTETIAVSTTSYLELVSERRADMGVDMRYDLSFNIRENVIYDYYEGDNGIIVFDFRTKTNPILHLTKNNTILRYLEQYYSSDSMDVNELIDSIDNAKVRLDDVFDAAILIGTSAYKRWSRMNTDVINGTQYDQEFLDSMEDYFDRDSVVKAHNIIASIPQNIVLIREILIGMKKKVSTDLFTQTAFIETPLGKRVVDIDESFASSNILKRSVKNIRKVSISSSFFFGSGTANTGIFNKTSYDNIISNLATSIHRSASISNSLFDSIVKGMEFNQKYGIIHRNVADVSNHIEKPPRFKKIFGIHQELFVGVVSIVSSTFETLVNAHLRTARVEEVYCPLATFNMEKRIHPYYANILKSIATINEVGVSGVAMPMVTVEIVGTYPVVPYFEKVYKVDINLADKTIFPNRSKFVFAKLMLYREAGRIIDISEFMSFNVTEKTFSQKMLLKHVYTDLTSAEKVAKLGKGSDGDIQEVGVKNKDQEHEETLGISTWTVCSDTGTSYMDYVGFDHVVTRTNGVHLGNFSFSEREVLNSAVIKKGRPENLGVGRQISKISGIQKSIKQKTISRFMAADAEPDWDPDNFEVTRDNLRSAGMSEREIEYVKADFDDKQAKVIEGFSMESSDATAVSELSSEDLFPEFKGRPFDDGTLSKKVLIKTHTFFEEED